MLLYFICSILNFSDAFELDITLQSTIVKQNMILSKYGGDGRNLNHSSFLFYLLLYSEDRNENLHRFLNSRNLYLRIYGLLGFYYLDKDQYFLLKKDFINLDDEVDFAIGDLIGTESVKNFLKRVESGQFDL